MSKPRLLDLFCGAGGAAMGYHRAGFEVVGVDIKPQPRYPFEFHQAGAMTFPLDGFDAVHSSPPCQRYSVSTNNANRHKHPDLYQAVKDRLVDSGLPFIIENVVKSPVRADFSICGCTVGLPSIRRRRQFETNWSGLVLMPPCQHVEECITVVGHGTPSKSKKQRIRKGLIGNISVAMKRAAMSIDWMNREELSQAIPPAYTQFIGVRLVEYLAK